MGEGAVGEIWGGRKGFVWPKKEEGYTRGQEGQQDPHWSLLRDPAQRGEELLSLLVPNLG